MIVIETPRLILRKFKESDLDELCALYADSEVRRYFPNGVLNREQTREELDWYLQGGFPGHEELGLWAAIHRPSGRFIGRSGLIPWTIEGKTEIEAAYLLAREFWRQGLRTEAAGALIRHGFTKLGLTRLIALIDARNVASIRTAEKMGFQFERGVVIEGTSAQLYSVSAKGRP